MNDIALVTANFSAIDDIKPLPPHDDIDAFYYTDDATRARASKAAMDTWTQVLVPNYPRYDFGSRLRAKYFKLQIHRLDEVRAYRWLVWADSSLQFHDLHFLGDFAVKLRTCPPRRRILLVPHPDRGAVREEYEFVRGEMARGNEYLRVRYESEKMPEQIEYYRHRGWDLGGGLFCGGFWMVENSEVLNRCWDDWWDQNLRFGTMDQLSLPFVLNEHGCAPEMFNVNIRKNDNFSFVDHQRPG